MENFFRMESQDKMILINMILALLAGLLIAAGYCSHGEADLARLPGRPADAERHRVRKILLHLHPAVYLGEVFAALLRH